MAKLSFPFSRIVADPGTNTPAGAYIVGAMMTANYARFGERLAASCVAHSLPLALFEVPSVHRSISVNGTDDLRFTKANFIMFLLERYARPVLYVDVDCVIAQRPERMEELLADHVDFAVFNWLAEEHTEAYVPAEPGGQRRFYRFSHSIDHRSETQLVCSGAVQWYHHTGAAHALLRAWQRVIECAPGCADDHCLDLAFNNWESHLHVLRAAWFDKRYARYAWWIYERPVIDHPEFPAKGQDFTALHELRGKPRIHADALRLEHVRYIFPKECLIDVDAHLLLRFHEGKWFPVGAVSTPLWL